VCEILQQGFAKFSRRVGLECHLARVKLLLGLLLLIAIGIARAEPLAIRVVAANLTSDNAQSYSPDNTNHSNPEGAGARILTALKPDIVLIQEFNTTLPARQWVNRTLGENYQFMREEGMQIPNGIISRFPIIRSGVWDDPVLSNRDFAWAKIRMPGDKELWVVSLHLHSKTPTSRDLQSAALVRFIQREIPADSLLLIGGDLNTRHTEEPCFQRLARVVIVPKNPPADSNGIIHTNAPRNRPYDWLLASAPLQRVEIPVKIAGREFPHGLVFDSRVFEPLDALPPVQKSDSGVKNMQHMAVVRDFLIP
jgi:endonuclease/exonuclease/phosphatase family metal-dependent hydrolase